MTGRLRRAASWTVALAAGLAAWQVGAARLGIPDYVLPPPSAVAARLVDTLPLQLEHLGATAATTLAGLALALAVGLALALSAVYVKPLGAPIVSAFAAFNGIPKVAVAPLFIIWFGLGSLPKIVLAFLMALFPVFVNATTGLGEVEPDMLDLARLAGGRELRVFRQVRLMHALPYLADAVKVAFPLALVGSVVGEFIGGNSGIGYLILSAQSNLDTPLVFACLVSITAFTSIGIGAIVAIEDAAFGWRPAWRDQRGAKPDA